MSDEGNLIDRIDEVSGDETDYAWDYRDRLISVTLHADQATSGHVRIDYKYDALDEMVARQKFVGTATSPAVSQHFVYDPQKSEIALELDDSGTIQHAFLWGPGVDQLLAATESSGSTAWAISDPHGTIDQWVDSSGNLLAGATLDSFGNPATHSATTPESLDLYFSYTGKYRDPLTGEQYNNARWYDPATGRFLSHDPIEADANSYRYASNDPVNKSDPSGLSDYYSMWDPRGYLWWFCGWERHADGTWNKFGSPTEAAKPMVADTLVALPPTRAFAMGAGAFNLAHQGLGNVSDLRRGEPLRGIDTDSTQNTIIVGGIGGPIVAACPALGAPLAAGAGVQGVREIQRGDYEQGAFDVVLAGGAFKYLLKPPRNTPNASSGRPGLELIRKTEPCACKDPATLVPSLGLRPANPAGPNSVSKSSAAIGSRYPANNGFIAEPKPTTLQTGTRIDRLGGANGKFASPEGTPFEMRSLRTEALERPLNGYEVVRPIEGVNSGCNCLPSFSHVFPRKTSRKTDNQRCVSHAGRVQMQFSSRVSVLASAKTR